ncbi:ABC transporter substrate-binding protein [Caldisphaera sp.]|uniref:ABC transporter substrate-binding protein n=1 Tax=Caldisphaera sp. TaxID=2060322 RepID=UPI003979D20B
MLIEVGKEWNRRSISKGLVISILVIAIVLIGAYVGIMYTHKSKNTSSMPSSSTSSQTLSILKPVSPASLNTIASSPLSVYLPGYTSSNGGYALVYTGNGSIINTTNSYVNLLYKYPGVYLIYYVVYQKGSIYGSSSQNLMRIIVTPNISLSLSQYLTVPTITFNSTENPSAPLFNVSQKIYLIGSFLQPPSGQNMTIYEYIWNFGNGTTETIMANQTTLLPLYNPVVVYNTPGLYAISLTIVTKNVSSGQTYNYTTYQTVAVSNSSLVFKIFTSNFNIPNPGTIIVAENVPGGPYSFDADIDLEVVGEEIIRNIYSTLVIYNGSSTSKFLPMAAEYLPTLGNWSQRNLYGGIAPNYTMYTFKIRPNLKAANGDNLTAYDVWYSIIRSLLCSGGVPPTPGYALAQYLIPNYSEFMPIVTSPNDTQGFNVIMNSVHYDNNTDTVTFNLSEKVNPQLFFSILTESEASVYDAKWLEQVGDGINFTPAGFYQYEQTCNGGNYNTQVQWDPLSTAPYMIKSYTPGQSIVLVPNPYWPNNIPDIPKPNNTVIIYWVKDPNTAYDMFSSGQADIVTNLPPSYVPLLLNLESNGQASIYVYPTFTENFFAFTLNTNTSMLKSINPNYNIPSYYFANTLVRKAFAYAFNYTQYLNDIIGNAKYHMNFGNSYCGILIPGLDYYIPPSELTGCPTFNLTYAKQLMEESGFYNITVNFPIFISSGDTADFTAAEMWAQALHEIDPNINAQPLYMPFVTMYAYDSIYGQNPMPIFYMGWSPGTPTALEFAQGMIEQGGPYAAPDGFNSTYLEEVSNYFASQNNTYLANLFANESYTYSLLNNLTLKAMAAEVAGNTSEAQSLYKQVDQLAINLYMYVYTIQPTNQWVVKPYIHGYNNEITWEENPLTNAAVDSVYWWWEK